MKIQKDQPIRIIRKLKDKEKPRRLIPWKNNNSRGLHFLKVNHNFRNASRMISKVDKFL